MNDWIAMMRLQVCLVVEVVFTFWVSGMGLKK
jgi:hypothetical protein